MLYLALICSLALLAQCNIDVVEMPREFDWSTLICGEMCGDDFVCLLIPPKGCIDDCEPRATCVQIPPQPTVVEQLCPVNSTKTECGSMCQPTCENPQPIFCTENCVPICQCDEGLILNSKNECVQKSKCFGSGVASVDNKVHNCPANSTWMECGSQCQPSCDDPDPKCTEVCVPTCQCDNGLILNSDEECVNRTECIPTPTLIIIKGNSMLNGSYQHSSNHLILYLLSFLVLI